MQDHDDTRKAHKKRTNRLRNPSRNVEREGGSGGGGGTTATLRKKVGEDKHTKFAATESNRAVTDPKAKKKEKIGMTDLSTMCGNNVRLEITPYTNKPSD